MNLNAHLKLAAFSLRCSHPEDFAEADLGDERTLEMAGS